MEENDEDIWGRDDYCNACRVKCMNESEKQEHRASQTHLKKWNLHKFFTQDSTTHETIGVSEMLERYKLSKIPVIGLHQCQEIQQIGLSNQEKANFWTCNICYEAGATFQSADDHLNSMNHIRNYMDECECEEKEEIEKDCDGSECDKYERYCTAAQQIFEREGGVEGLQPPSILRMNFSKEEGNKRFGIDDVSDVTFQACPGNDDHKILSCSTCNEVAPVHLVGKYTLERARENHYDQPSHRTCATITAIINEFNPEEIYEEFDISQCSMDQKWIEKNPDQWYFSQPCGYRYSVRAGKETICTVCYVLVDTDKMIDHFSSETHIMKYLNMIKPHSAYVATQLSGAERRTKALTTLLSAYSLEMDNLKVAAISRFPTVIKQKLSVDFHAYTDPPIEIIEDFKETTGKIYRFCQLCTTYIEFDGNMVDTPKRMSAAWKSHVLSTAHFETAAIRTRVHFDRNFFVPYSPTIGNAETDTKGVWKVDNKNVLIQTQCDVGLEYMVEDEQTNEVTCQCCWKVLSKNPALVHQHVRSYDHLKQYIYLEAPDNVRILLGPETDEAKQEFMMMNFLRRQSGVFPKRMNMYSKMKALELSSWTPISLSFVQIYPKLNSYERECFDTLSDLVDKVSGDNGEKISARDALIFTRMVIINTTRGIVKELGSVVCRCEDCGLLVVADAATWQRDIFDSHLCTEEHRKRTEVRKKHIINAYGIRPERSTYIVKPFVQKADNKKVVWQWNATTKKHEYVHGLVGLEDIIECRVPDDRNIAGIETKTVFFCTLCATIIQKRGDELALHMREMSHCINWVHKHRPTHIRDLFNHVKNDVDKGKELRKFLQTLLKDVYSPADYCMLAYDPDGVEKDMQNEIKLKIKTEEKRKKMEAGRERAAAEKERKRLEKEARDLEVEEQRRRIRQKKQEEEQRYQERAKARQAEDAAGLEYAQKNVHKYHQQTPEDVAYNKRLNGNSVIEQQKHAERQSIDIKQAKLEAERRKLLSASQSTGSAGPKLVILPQLKSQPPVAHNPYGVPPTMPAAAPAVNLHPETLRFNLTQQASQVQQPTSYFGPPRLPVFQQNLPPPNVSMAFPVITQPDLPAYVKRPSLRGQRVDPVVHDVTKIKNKADLFKYMHSRGATTIVDQAELPNELSQKIQDHPETFGVKYVTEIVCMDDPSLDSYLCTICDDWSDSNGMIKHLCSAEHKSKFLHYDYRSYYDEVMREKNLTIRKTIFKNFTEDLKKKQVGAYINLRMQTLIDKSTIERLWPGYEEYFNKKVSTGAWSTGGFKPVAGPPVILPEAIKVPTLFDDDIMEVDEREAPKKKRDDGRERRRDRSRSRNRSRRSRSREDRRRRSRTRSRSRSRDRHYRSHRDRRSRSRTRSRSRSRSRSRDRHDSRSSRSRQNTWVDQTDSFLAKVGDGRSSSGAKNSATADRKLVHPPTAQLNLPPAPQVSEYDAKMATLRGMTQSGEIRGSQIDSFIATNTPPPALGVPTHSAESRRQEVQRQEEEKSRKQRHLATMMALDELVAKYGNTNVPRPVVLDLFTRFGWNELEGDMIVEDFIANHGHEQIFQTGTGKPTGISDVILSFGIGTKPIPSQPPPVQHQQPQPQYGISSVPTSSAYSQVFGNQTLPQTQQTAHNVSQSFYSDPPTSMDATPEARDDSSDDEEDDYQDIYQAIRKPNPKQKPEQQPKEAGILPGQKMALNRTILPNGARVGEQLPSSSNATPVLAGVASSPTPSDSSSVVIVTPNSATATPLQSQSQVPAGRPLLAPSLGMPAPIAVTKVVPQQPPPPQMMYQPQQPGYPSNTSQYQQQPVYQQQGQYPQQLYQQPPPHSQQPSQYSQQYGIQQAMYQQPPPQHLGYQQQNAYPPSQPQYAQQQQPQYPQVNQQQYPPQQPPQHPQYYQQQPPAQNNGASPAGYGIGGAQQHYYWPPQ